MMSLVIVVHVLACVVLIIIILIQRGRGGGFIESFAGLESMFGTKTSAFLSRLTSILAVVFFVSCLSLAFLSLKESKSLMHSAKPKVMVAPKALTGNTTVPAEQEIQEPAQQPASEAVAPVAAPVNQTAQ
jgi:preprotein translocase subunit SecG